MKIRGIYRHLQMGLVLLTGILSVAVSGGMTIATAEEPTAATNTAVEIPGQSQLDFANGLFHRAFFAEAIEEYERYLTEYPSTAQAPLAWYRLGKAASAAKQYDKALNAFEKVEELTPEPTQRVEALLSKGEILYFLKRFDEAETVLGLLLKGQNPSDLQSRALYYLGKVQQSKGQMESAAQQYKKLIKTFPDSPLLPFARYQLAFVYLEQQDTENAAIEFSAVANNTQADKELRMESRFRAAEIYDKIGWFSAAIGAYEQLRTDFPQSTYARRADYGYAWALYHAGKYPEAIVAAQAFEKAYPDAPHLAGIAYLRANCLQQQKQYEQAQQTYQAIRENYPDSPFAVRAQYKTAWVLFLKGDGTAAKEEVTAFLQRQKDSPLIGDAAFLLGSILVSEGNFEDAQQEFRLVAEKYPKSEFGAEALYKSAECLGQLGLTDQAAKTFETFAKRYPSHRLTEPAILRAGDAQFSADDFAQAVEQYQQILARSVDATVEEETLYRLAVTYHNMKDYAKSVETFRTLLEKFAQSPHATEAHLRIGNYILREEKKPAQALESYQAVIQNTTASPELLARALRGAALAHYEQKHHDEAAAAFLRLIRDYPDTKLNEGTYAWLGQHFYDLEKWGEAAQSFEALLANIQDYPAPERVRLKIAECIEKSGDIEKALQQYQTVIDTASQSTKAVEAKYRMACLYETQGKTEEAFALYEAAANANNGDLAARARFRLGELYEQREEFDKAARSYLRVAILFLHETLSPEALWRAGQCFEKAGSSEQAQKTYSEILSDYPESPQAEKVKALQKQASQSQ